MVSSLLFTLSFQLLTLLVLELEVLSSLAYFLVLHRKKIEHFGNFDTHCGHFYPSLVHCVGHRSYGASDLGDCPIVLFNELYMHLCCPPYLVDKGLSSLLDTQRNAYAHLEVFFAEDCLKQLRLDGYGSLEHLHFLAFLGEHLEQVKLTGHVERAILAHLRDVLGVFLALDQIPEDFVYFLAVLHQLAPDDRALSLLKLEQARKECVLFRQSSDLSPFDFLKDLDVHVADLSQLDVHALADLVDVVSSLLHAPHDSQQALQALLVIERTAPKPTANASEASLI